MPALTDSGSTPYKPGMAKDYVFDNAWTEERRRIASIEAVFDPGTKRVLESAGADDGRRVLEVGAGGGSIARWLAERGCKVLATDLDTRFLDEIDHPNLEVHRHDIIADDLEEDAFDLVHARCLLEHLPARAEVLKRLLTALKSGGWIVIEDVDWVPDTTIPAAKLPVYPPQGAGRYAKVWRAMAKLGAMVGIDGEYARRLPYTLMEAGLVDVDAESRNKLVQGGSVEADFNVLTLQQVQALLVGQGFLTEREVSRAVAETADPTRYYMSATMVAAWGRKPG